MGYNSSSEYHILRTVYPVEEDRKDPNFRTTCKHGGGSHISKFQTAGINAATEHHIKYCYDRLTRSWACD